MTPTDKQRAVEPVFLWLDGRTSLYVGGAPFSSPFAMMPPASPPDPATVVNVIYDAAVSGVRLGSAANRPIPLTEPSGTFGGLTRPTGLAVGRNGRLFLADPTHNRILSYAPELRAFVPLWESPPISASSNDCIPPAGAEPDAYMLNSPRGVAWSPDGDLVVADTGHSRVIFYSWPGLAPRQIIELPNGTPVDLAYDSAGRLYIADASGGRIRRYDRLWRADHDFLGGAGSLAAPRHLAISASGLIFVLDAADPPRLIALDPNGVPLDDADPLIFAQTFPPALIADGRGGIALPQDERPSCPAMVLHGVSINRYGMLEGTQDKAELPLVARPRRVQYPRQGVFFTCALDSGLLNCVWNRLVLDADIPDATSLTIRTFTAAAALEDRRVVQIPIERWSRPLTITTATPTEILIQSPPGRYLWLHIDLNSNGSATPVIRSAAIYAPRQSSLQFLPPVFHEDSVSADLLDRFLSYFDTIFAEAETVIEGFTAYLDPDGVPSGEFLSWLGQWFDLQFLAVWDDNVRREFIRRAIELYKRRGTIGGMQAILELHTGVVPTIIEHFRLVNYLGSFEAADAGVINNTIYVGGQPLPAPATPAEGAHRFTIVLPAYTLDTDDEEHTLRRLIEAQKPAHTGFELRTFNPGIRIGCQSTIGVDMQIAPYPQEPIGEITLGYGQLPPPADASPRLGRSRLLLSER
jgi:phage tail-like protein